MYWFLSIKIIIPGILHLISKGILSMRALISNTSFFQLGIANLDKLFFSKMTPLNTALSH